MSAIKWIRPIGCRKTSLSISSKGGGARCRLCGQRQALRTDLRRTWAAGLLPPPLSGELSACAAVKAEGCLDLQVQVLQTFRPAPLSLGTCPFLDHERGALRAVYLSRQVDHMDHFQLGADLRCGGASGTKDQGGRKAERERRGGAGGARKKDRARERTREREGGGAERGRPALQRGSRHSTSDR